MSWVLWTAVAGLVAALVALQVVGVRALESWGVRPSGAVLGLRAANVAAVAGVVVFAFWKWVG